MSSNEGRKMLVTIKKPAGTWFYSPYPKNKTYRKNRNFAHLGPRSKVLGAEYG